jgi:hypothetical protein
MDAGDGAQPMAMYPDSFAAIITAAVRKHKTNIDSAVDAALSKLEQEPEFEAWKEQMVRDKIRELVTHRRSNLNTPRCMNPSRFIHNDVPAIRRTIIDLPDIASKIAETITLDYMIGGKTLGTLYGKELVGLAERSWSSGQKHLVMAHLAARLSRIVPREKQVQDVVSKSELAKIAAQVANGSIMVPPACVEAA